MFARAQQPAKLSTIGVLSAATLSTTSPWVAAFLQRLRDFGWAEGRNIAIEYRWAEGRSERYAEIAAEFVRKVDVIVTHSTPPVVAAKQATSVIPIVFANASIRLLTASSRAWRGRAATSPACRSKEPTLPPSDSTFGARSSQVCVGWRS